MASLLNWESLSEAAGSIFTFFLGMLILSEGLIAALTMLIFIWFGFLELSGVVYSAQPSRIIKILTSEAMPIIALIFGLPALASVLIWLILAVSSGLSEVEW